MVACRCRLSAYYEVLRRLDERRPDDRAPARFTSRGAGGPPDVHGRAAEDEAVVRAERRKEPVMTAIDRKHVVVAAVVTILVAAASTAQAQPAPTTSTALATRTASATPTASATSPKSTTSTTQTVSTPSTRWSVEVGIGWDNGISGNINSSGVGVLNNQVVVITKNSYEDVYGTGLHLRFGGGYMLNDSTELIGIFTFQSLDADFLVRMG